jgi:cellulose synthase/poly-beta-1,6-N-acetylglucosamine synthase-like glycosyltransferase
MIISFVIPAYNEEERIAFCVSSIKSSINSLNDKSIETEIIVVNNASTDSTKEILSKINYVKVVDESRKGIVWARRAGFLASKGDIIANIDADTLMTPKWLKTAIEYFKDPNLFALSGPSSFYDSPKYINFFVIIFYFAGYCFDKINKLLFHSGSMFQGGNFLVRRSALNAIGGFDTSIEFYGEDVDIGRRINKIGKVIWTFKLPMKTSGRRFVKQGLIKTGIIYLMNFMWITLLGKPFNKEHIDVRTIIK